MPDYSIRFARSAVTRNCAGCCQAVNLGNGPHLWVTSTAHPLCPNCGKKQAPALCALLELAHVAYQVGKISKHARSGATMESLLRLERAAANYVAELCGE